MALPCRVGMQGPQVKKESQRAASECIIQLDVNSTKPASLCSQWEQQQASMVCRTNPAMAYGEVSICLLQAFFTSLWPLSPSYNAAFDILGQHIGIITPVKLFKHCDLLWSPSRLLQVDNASR